MARKPKMIYLVVDGKMEGEITLKDAREMVGNSRLSFAEIEEGLYPTLTLDAKKAGITIEVEFPEKGSITDPKELKRFYKKLSNEQLDEWLALEGLTYTESDHAAINRMRKCMAILYYFFPKETKGKKKSVYAGYSTEDLIAMATEAQVTYKPSENEPIMRMRLIMALREAGYIA